VAHQRNQKKNQEQVKQNLRNSRRGNGNTRKSKQSSYQSNDEKPECPAQHPSTSCGFLIALLVWKAPSFESGCEMVPGF
jgi:hypothetical protein